MGAPGDFFVVVDAMCHDQGHGPAKVLGLDAGVNITSGRSCARAPGRGITFDIADTGKA